MNSNALVENVSIRLDRELDPFTDHIVTPQGQIIETMDQSGNWQDKLTVENLGYVSNNVKWGCRFHDDDYVEWIIRSWIIDSLETNLTVRRVQAVTRHLETLAIHERSPELVEEALFEWAMKGAIAGASKEGSSLLWGVRQVYEWCLEEDLPNFSEYRKFEIDSVRPRWRNQELSVSLRDTSTGPFTSLEVSLIETALKSSNRTTTEEMALFYLARDWGLRPIQFSLLRTSDFGRDTLGPFIMVPSVKGKKRSRLRREASNMVKRYISADTAEAIEAQISVAELSVKARIEVLQKQVVKQPIGTPLFPNKYCSDERAQRFFSNPRLVDYTLHKGSHRVSRTFRKLTQKLSITPPKRLGQSIADAELPITSYRFRRTKGTAMVINGATPEEVAEALDHVSVDSIKHYFHFSSEVHDFINEAHASSPDISTAVQMWEGRIAENLELSVNELSIVSLGKCTRGSICPYHPTVTCYSCQNFRPNKSANHQAALDSIMQLKDIIATSSTGPVLNQLEVAIYGAKAVIVAIEEEYTK